MRAKRVIQLCAAISSFTAVIQAQPKEPDSHFSFEVASIKPSNLLNGNQSINFAPGGQLKCTNVSLRMLVRFAYNMRDDQLVNVPGWAETEHYDILAKPSADDLPGEPPEHSEAAVVRLRARTQSLLAERFGVVSHPETREMPILALVVAKGGPKLGEPKPAADIPASGPNGPQISFNDRRVSCKNVTMQRFSQGVLGPKMARDVIDQTGLDGAYDFKMDFVPDEGASRRPGDASASEPTGPSFLAALQEQLGLRLEHTKGPVHLLVIDKIERPSAN
jgi:uncharacterized protein (TIGR03435 family)